MMLTYWKCGEHLFTNRGNSVQILAPALSGRTATQRRQIVSRLFSSSHIAGTFFTVYLTTNYDHRVENTASILSTPKVALNINIFPVSDPLEHVRPLVPHTHLGAPVLFLPASMNSGGQRPAQNAEPVPAYGSCLLFSSNLNSR